MSNTSNERLQNFNKIAKWLTDADIEIETKSSEPTEDYVITAIITKSKDGPDSDHWFTIHFPKAYPDTIVLHQRLYFEDLDLKAFNSLSEKLQQQYFIDIRKSVYPLGVIVSTKESAITLKKMIFPETLTRQSFFDYFWNFAHAFEICAMKYNELRLSLFPDK